MQLLRTICDQCHDRGELTDGKPHSITVDGRKIEIDLCDPDLKQLEESLADIFRIGRRPEGEKRHRRTKAEMEQERAALRDVDPLAVNVCVICHDPKPSRAALRDHLRKVHHTSIKDLRAAGVTGRPEVAHANATGN